MAEARLQVRDALGTRTVPIDHNPFTIGRRMSNHLQLAASEVSREHAEIVLENGEYRLRDLHSRYGTYLGGEPVSECTLRPGDLIRLGRDGSVELVFLAEGESLSETLGITAGGSDGVRALVQSLSRLRALGPGRVLHDVLTIVLDTALEISKADRGFIMLAGENDKLELRVARGPAGQTLSSQPFARSQKFPEEVYRTGRTVVISDLNEFIELDEHQNTRDLGIRQVICVPLHQVHITEAAVPGTDIRRIGVLYLDGTGERPLVSASMQASIEDLAIEASIAIENARLYRAAARLEHENEMAAAIQRALLPHSAVRLPYLEAAADSSPCRSVGGDFFDYLGKGGPTFACAVGDVAGKGPSAALLSAMMQGMLAFAWQEGEGNQPAAIVTRINRALCQRAAELRFVTMVLAMIDPDGRLSYCNAGHNPPFIVGRSGVRQLPSGGPVVGLLEYARYEQETIALEAGDVLVIYSDGVTDARSSTDDEFGEARLLEAIQRAVEKDMPGLVEEIITAVRSFTTGAQQFDDITVMAIRYIGPAS